MDSLAILLPIALLFFGIAAGLFWWAVSDKQYEDLDREGQRILFDVEAETKTRKSEGKSAGNESPSSKEQPRHDA